MKMKYRVVKERSLIHNSSKKHITVVESTVVCRSLKSTAIFGIRDFCERLQKELPMYFQCTLSRKNFVQKFAKWQRCSFLRNYKIT